MSIGLSMRCLYRWNSDILTSNSTVTALPLNCLTLSCTGRGLAMGRNFVQGVVPKVSSELILNRKRQETLIRDKVKRRIGKKEMFSHVHSNLKTTAEWAGTGQQKAYLLDYLLMTTIILRTFVTLYDMLLPLQNNNSCDSSVGIALG
jgi:hypothetical protein